MSKLLPDDSARYWSGRGGDAPIRFGFLLVPDFTLIGFGSAVDPLRLANMVARRTLYQFVTLTMDGQPVRSSAGICVQPDLAASAATDLDGVFVIGPNPIPTSGNEPIIQWLRNQTAKGVPLGGVDTGSYFLACAGLLDGYRSTIHWEDMDALLDRFPRLVVSNKLYEVDRNRCSCSGGIAPVEMMIHLIGLGGGGRKVASSVAELLIYERRGPDERQKTSLRDVSGASHPKLVEAIKLMECNIEEPLPMEELAEHMQFSARQLLTRTNRPIADIVMACGFVSFAHFSHRYHAGFGISPSAERRRHTSDPEKAIKQT